MLKKGDFIIGIVLLLLIAVSYLGVRVYRHFLGDTEHTALVIKDGEVLYSINLEAVSNTERIKVDGKYKHVILVEPGKIRFCEADCPDKVCVRTGWLKDPGDTAVCIPGNIIIKVEGQKSDVDAVSY